MIKPLLNCFMLSLLTLRGAFRKTLV